MPSKPAPPEHSWTRKFRNAFRGAKLGVRGQSSFFVHFFAAATVVAAALALSCSLVEWCLLVGSIAAVLAAEMFNTSLERLAKAVDQRHNPHLRDALDIGSAAVLLAAVGAAAIGAIIFIHRLGDTLDWWK